jgi:hypothetical protein
MCMIWYIIHRPVWLLVFIIGTFSVFLLNNAIYTQWISKVAADTPKLSIICTTDFGYRSSDHPYHKVWCTTPAEYWGRDGFKILEVWPWGVLIPYGPALSHQKLGGRVLFGARSQSLSCRERGTNCKVPHSTHRPGSTLQGTLVHVALEVANSFEVNVFGAFIVV